MSKKIAVIIALLGMAGTALLLGSYEEVGRRLLEFILNQSSKEFFAKSIHVEKVHLNWNGKIRIEGVEGKLQTASGPVPLRMESVKSQNSVFNFLSNQGWRLEWNGLRPEHSERGGIRGIATLRGGREGFFEIAADVLGVDLGEIRWISPENLAGSMGEMKGKVLIRADSRGSLTLMLRLHIDEPGGKVDAHFFDLLKPYLPKLREGEGVKRIQGTGGLVSFRRLIFEAALAEADRMKVFFQMAVPDYNLDLNLNVEIRIDEENAFPELARLIGFLKERAG